MKIYFAGSITGGRDDVAIYAEIIEILKSYGQVLTEHISDKSISHLGESVKKTPEFIYNRDMDWLKDADVVVAEITMPSLGVGYELGGAQSLGKKVLCLYRENAGKRLSSMIKGNSYMKVEIYKEASDVPKILEEFFK